METPPPEFCRPTDEAYWYLGAGRVVEAVNGAWHEAPQLRGAYVSEQPPPSEN